MTVAQLQARARTALGITLDTSPEFERGDLLVNSILGIIATSVVVGVGAPYFMHFWTSAQTFGAREMLTDANTSISNYFMDTQTVPPATWLQFANCTSNNQYAPAPLVDPLAPTNCAELTITGYAAANGQQSYIIQDSVVHPSETLFALPKYPGTMGTEPTTTCGLNGCTRVMYDPNYKMMGY